jgi:hypothetical protein
MKIEILETENIFLDNPIYFPPSFSNIAFQQTAPIPAVAFIARRDSQKETFEQLAKHLVQGALVHAVPDDFQLFLFCAHWKFLDDTQIVRRKGFWRSSNLLKSIAANAIETGPERAFKEGTRVRYYGLCSIGIQQAQLAINIIRSTHTSFGIIDRQLDVVSETVADDLFRLAFPTPTKGDIDWSTLIPSGARGNRALVRAHGGFDDRELSLDLINWRLPKQRLPVSNISLRKAANQ